MQKKYKIPEVQDASPEEADAPVIEPDPAPIGKRLNRAFGPIMAGMIIDVLDLATFGPIGYVLGLPVGGAAGYWLGRCLGLSRKASLFCALAAGIYCTVPFTGILPLGTLVGAYVRFRDEGWSNRSARVRTQSTGTSDV